MPFPANWLEELVVEWLDLEGFTTSTGISVPAGAGGRWSPDVVGAKMDAAGCLMIRHCEATMWFTQGPENATKKFSEKFSPNIENAVRKYFSRIFDEHAMQQANYEKWVITCGVPSARVRTALEEGVPGIRVCVFKDFVFKEVLRTVRGCQFLCSTRRTVSPSRPAASQDAAHSCRQGLAAGQPRSGATRP